MLGLFALFAAFASVSATFDWGNLFNRLPYRAGFATADIAPTDAQIAAQNVFLGGYGFLGIRDTDLGTPGVVTSNSPDAPLKSKAACFSDRPRIFPNAKTFCIATLDAPGMGNKIRDEIKASVSSLCTLLGLDVDNVFLSSTHTHSGPDLQGVWGGVSTDYRQMVVNRTARAISAAFLRMRPVKLFVSNMDFPGDNVNRRDWGYAFNHTTVIQAKTLSGRVLGQLVNWHAHPTVISYDSNVASADWVGYARNVIEAEYGGTAVLVNGAIGDVLPFFDKTNATMAAAYGDLIGNNVVDTVTSSQVQMTGKFQIDTRAYTHGPTDNPNILGFFLGGFADPYYNYNVVNSSFTVDTQISYLRMGDQFETVMWPGELLTKLAVDVLEPQYVASAHGFFGLTGDSLGYFIPNATYGRGYETNGGTEERFAFNNFGGDELTAMAVTMMAENQALY